MSLHLPWKRRRSVKGSIHLEDLAPRDYFIILREKEEQCEQCPRDLIVTPRWHCVHRKGESRLAIKDRIHVRERDD